MTIVVDDEVEPVFSQLGPYCLNAVPDILPLTSENGITGTWNPATISTDAVGILTYTFTPDAGQCAGEFKMEIETVPLLEVEVTITADNTEVLPGESVTFTAVPVNGGDDPVYVWYVNGAEQTGETSETFAYKPNDGDEVYVTLTSSLDCADSDPAPSNVIVITLGAPLFSCPPTITLECNIGEIPDPLVGLQAWFNNGGKADSYRNNSFKWVSDVSDNNSCPETITRTYMIRDKRGDTLYCEQLIIIIDTIKPLIAIDAKQVICVDEVPPVYATFEEFMLNGGTASDECALDTMSFRYLGETSDGNGCPVTLTRTYAIADECGNWNEAQEIITVNDTVPPQLLTCPGDFYSEEDGETVEVLSGLPFSDTEQPIAFADTTALGISAADNCEVKEITYRDEAVGTCLQVITRTIVAYDGCGNTDTCTFTITLFREVVPEFDPIGPLCQFDAAPALPDTSLNGVSGSWSPAVIDTGVTGTVMYVFTPGTGLCAATDSMAITILEHVEPAFAFNPEICQFDVPPALPATDIHGVTGTWSPDTIDTRNAEILTFVFTPDSLEYPCADTTRITLEIHEFIQPDLAPIGPFCQFDTAPLLPPADLNGVAGTWAPAVISTDVPDTLWFVFTPDEDRCSVSDSIEVIIYREIVPDFDLAGEFCQFDTPPALPATDMNGVKGTWSPDTINTNNPGSQTFVFTPDPSLYACALTAEFKVQVYRFIQPELDPLGPLCQFDTAPLLKDTDRNGEPGTWSPAVISTDVPDTLWFVFTPDNDTCSVSDSIEVIIYEKVVPEFDLISEICQFEIPPALPPADLNGVKGTWLPDTINTNNPGPQTFVFTPDASLYACAVPTVLNVEVYEFIQPELDPVGPLCQFDPAQVLPATDRNGVPGTWSPAVVSTDVPDTLWFVFTPDQDRCSVTDSVQVIIYEKIVPEFDLISEICQFETPPALPSTDRNGIRGTWTPAEINTLVAGTFTYTFTPEATYACSEPYVLAVTVNTLIIPQFAAMGPFCQDSEAPALPEANFNGVTGTWIPAVIATGEPGIHPYVFVPDENLGCAERDTLWIEILPTVVPVFDPIGPLCLDAVPPALPLTSVNGVTGTWEPAVIQTGATGTFSYEFTPDGSTDCAIGESITVEVIGNTPPVAEDDNAITLRDEPVQVNVLDNDTDSNGAIDATSVAVVTQPVNGKVNVHPVTGRITYKPDAGFFGTDSLVYSVCDDGIPCGPLCDTATVIILVKEPNNPPVARNDSFTVMCYPLIEYLLPNDYDPDGDNIRIVQFPMVDVRYGTVTIERDGAFIYMPDEGFVGIDTFVYRIYDDGYPEMWDEAMVWINVLPEVDCDNLPGEDEEDPTECALMIPDGFSPNGDDVHDFFQIYCIDKYPDATLRIFDRAGNKLFQKQHYGNLNFWGSDENAWWWGNSEHKLTLGRGTLPAGTYLYVLELGTGEVRTGTVMIAY